MMRIVLAGLSVGLLALASSGARAQGALDESLASLGEAVRNPVTRSLLPPQVDLTATLPVPRGQGGTSSCVSWSVTYAAATQALRRADPGTPALSPAFTYNQVSGDATCQRGTQISTTLNLLRDVGALPLDLYAFDGGWCGRRPTAPELSAAARYRIRGWSAFDASEPDRVKAQLAEGHPVIFSVPMGSGLRAHRGDGVFAMDTAPEGRHAMLVIGYDDARQAFRVQNSWGRGWGDDGYAWFGYPYWRTTVRSGFVID